MHSSIAKQIVAFAFAIALLPATSVFGAVFRCDETGFQAAIAAASGGDAGPHEFDCVPPEVITLTRLHLIPATVTLDGNGVTEFSSGLSSGGSFPQTLPQFILIDNDSHVEFRDIDFNGVGLLSLRGPPSGPDPPLWGGSLKLDRCRISNVSGTALQVLSGSFELIDSSIVDNLLGCGVTVGATPTLIQGSTIARNGGRTCGGVASTGPLAILNSTISDNVGMGGALGFAYANVHSIGETHIQNATITSDLGPNFQDWVESISRVLEGPAPFEFVIVHGSTTIENSIVEGFCSLEGPLSSGGGNVESPGDTCSLIDSTDQVDVSAADLNLGLLALDGGSTETHALLPGSVAIDVAEDCPPPDTDQRGILRPQGEGCDSGAYELEVLVPAVRICDANGDDSNDWRDIREIRSFLKSASDGPGDPRDGNGDGFITPGDARLCARRCDLPRCGRVEPWRPKSCPGMEDWLQSEEKPIREDGFDRRRTKTNAKADRPCGPRNHTRWFKGRRKNPPVVDQ